jgi:hypothetical protein
MRSSNVVEHKITSAFAGRITSLAYRFRCESAQALTASQGRIETSDLCTVD